MNIQRIHASHRGTLSLLSSQLTKKYPAGASYLSGIIVGVLNTCFNEPPIGKSGIVYIYQYHVLFM